MSKSPRPVASSATTTSPLASLRSVLQRVEGALDVIADRSNRSDRPFWALKPRYVSADLGRFELAAEKTRAAVEPTVSLDPAHVEFLAALVSKTSALGGRIALNVLIEIRKGLNKGIWGLEDAANLATIAAGDAARLEASKAATVAAQRKRVEEAGEVGAKALADTLSSLKLAEPPVDPGAAISFFMKVENLVAAKLRAERAALLVKAGGLGIDVHNRDGIPLATLRELVTTAEARKAGGMRRVEYVKTDDGRIVSRQAAAAERRDRADRMRDLEELKAQAKAAPAAATPPAPASSGKEAQGQPKTFKERYGTRSSDDSSTN